MVYVVVDGVQGGSQDGPSLRAHHEDVLVYFGLIHGQPADWHDSTLLFAQHEEPLDRVPQQVLDPLRGSILRDGLVGNLPEEDLPVSAEGQDVVVCVGFARRSKGPPRNLRHEVSMEIVIHHSLRKQLLFTPGIVIQ